MIFAVSTDELQKQLQNRLGQCVLTSPGSACFAGLEGATELKLGSALRYFGDGWQISKKLGGRHFWRVPVMDGEFLCEATTGLTKEAVGGGNLLLLAADQCQGAGGRRSGGCGDREGAGRDHAVPGRHRPLGLQGRRQVQGHDGLDQRRLRARRCAAW